MKYPIAIEPGNDTQAWGVVVPDLPGCFSAADDEDDIIIFLLIYKNPHQLNRAPVPKISILAIYI